ncbi:MAG TPA: NAD(P)-dependent oxidoreductase [Gemmatimonadales bacterium]|jgi:3-hydroxyisobutyrate dehydrogenase|nr:NAD(P)-dependent oxidoreductase [Gemmatimonadales bacterium]
MNLAFLGLGAIGTPMAAHLARSHRLVVWNRTASKAREFAEAHGAAAVETPRDAAADSEVVITCLPTSREVEELLDGPDGILAGIAPGTLFLDCTSGDPATSRKIAARLKDHGVMFADAPVSGGTDGAEAAALTVMVGGDAATFERARPIVAAFGKRIEHMGPVGAGHAMKAVNNALLAANILTVAEGALALVKAGVDPARAFEVLNASSGRSFVSERLVPERVLTGKWPVTFRLALLEKDTGIATGFLAEQEVRAPILALVRQLFGEARLELGEEADYLEAIKLLERQAGAELRYKDHV